MIFVDESGAHLGMTRDYGRAPGKERLYLPRVNPRGHKFSMISAISHQKILAGLYGEGSVDSHFFLHFVEHYLAPELKPGNKVIMDNISFHYHTDVRKLVEATGASLIFLPAYSPDLSPIENMWSKIKSILRKLEARCPKTFKHAISQAFSAIEPKDLQGWFKHCGYKDQLF